MSVHIKHLESLIKQAEVFGVVDFQDVPKLSISHSQRIFIVTRPAALSVRFFFYLMLLFSECFSSYRGRVRFRQYGARARTRSDISCY